MGEDYPKTLLELEERFGNEEACRHYLGQLRWPTGFICPFCRGKGGWLDRRQRWTCQACRRQSTVTAGTIFEGTHLPLRVWFRAAGWSPARSLEPAPWGCNASWGWEAMKQLGVGSQIAPGDGSSKARASLGHRGSGRGVYWRSDARCCRSHSGAQSVGRDCRGRGR